MSSTIDSAELNMQIKMCREEMQAKNRKNKGAGKMSMKIPRKKIKFSGSKWRLLNDILHKNAKRTFALTNGYD